MLGRGPLLVVSSNQSGLMSVREIVAAAIAETGAEGPKDTGQVMKAAMAKVAGQADGKRVSSIAQEALSG